jgi:membrane protein CcdC involved in cytochrome C biogenesis
MNSSLSVTILLLIVGIVVTLLMVLVLRKKRERKSEETDYRAFFIMGVAFLPTGFAMMMVYLFSESSFEVGLPLFILGLIYLIIGLANRDKWTNKQ